MLEKGDSLKSYTGMNPDLTTEAVRVAIDTSVPIVHIPRFEAPITPNIDIGDERPVRILPNLTFRQITGPWRPLRDGEEIPQEDTEVIHGIPHTPIRKRDA